MIDRISNYGGLSKLADILLKLYWMKNTFYLLVSVISRLK